MRRKLELEFAVDDVKAFKIVEKLFDQFYNRKGFFADARARFLSVNFNPFLELTYR